MESQRSGNIMAAVARWFLEERGDRDLNKTTHGNTTSTNPLYQSETHNKTSETAELIASLVFAESKSIRTSTIILAAFNILAAVATAASILYDCYWASKRCNPKYKASKFCVKSIHPAETFPLLLAIGIAIQGVVFAGVSGEGLTSLFTPGCSIIAQFMWPALFIVPYLQLVFGMECALRSLRSLPFQARGKYDVTICAGAVVVMLIGTWIPSHLYPQPDVCFASLVWFVTRYGQLGLELLSAAAGLMILSAVIIFVRLCTVNLIDEHQRIAASRMVYYLVLGIVSLAFVIPFFGSLTGGGQGDLKLGMMATVVLNLSGMMSGLLHLFLRSNTAATSFGSKEGRHWDRNKHHIRIFGPNELGMHNHLVDPVTGPRGLSSRATSRASLVPEKGRIISMDSLTSPTISSPKSYEAGEMPSKPTSSFSPSRAHARKPSYSLFPAEASSPTRPTQQPASIYDIGDLAPPPVAAWTGARHRRDSSISSSATVQIGLRISHAPPQPDVNTLPLPSRTYESPVAPATTTEPTPMPLPTLTALPSTTYSAFPSTNPLIAPTPSPSIPPTPRSNPFHSPLKLQTTPTPCSRSNPFHSHRKPQTTPTPSPRSNPFHSRLKLQTNPSTSPTSQTSAPIPTESPRRPTPQTITTITTTPSSPTQKSSPLNPNKTLPPTPRAFLPRVDTAATVRESTTQLTPAVYSPKNHLGRKTSGADSGSGVDVTAPLSLNRVVNSDLLKEEVPLSPSGLAMKRSGSERGAGKDNGAKGDWI